jgi:hypothetical protein
MRETFKWATITYLRQKRIRKFSKKIKRLIIVGSKWKNGSQSWVWKQYKYDLGLQQGVKRLERRAVKHEERNSSYIWRRIEDRWAFTEQ